MDERRPDTCPNCGNEEFITGLNAYDIYQIVGGKPEFVRSETADGEFRLFCRDCGEELVLAENV